MKTLLILLAVYFCSPTGGGSGASYDNPCSLSTGLSKSLQPGDTLYLLGGQYDLGNTIVQNLNGSSTKNIVISGYPGEKAILDFRTTPYGTRGLQVKSTCSRLHIKDLTLRYSGKNNLYNEGSYCLFENLDIYGSADTGCQMKTGGNNIIKNCDSHDNFDYENGGIDRADFGGNADGFADKQHQGAPNHYIGCRAWNNGDDGWDFFQRTTNSDSTIIENCICYINGPAEYDMRNHPRYQVDKAWFDNINGKTVTNRYGERQVVTLEHYPCHGNGNGFKMGGNYTTHKILIHHCLAVANTARGFDQNNNGGTMWVYNNTGLLNGFNYGFTTAYGTLAIQNNISFRSLSADTHQSKTTKADSHNSWNGKSASASDFQSLDTTQILAPRQANGDLAEGTLMRLAAGSQYIDAGTNVGLFYTGSAPDMGWKEIPGDTIWPTPPGPEPEYECKDGAYPVAYLTTPNDYQDTVILNYLRKIDSLCITILDATENDHDYSEYELLIISPVPSSSYASIKPAKDAALPKLILKPFIYKSTVWNWGNPENTALTDISITDTTHVIFEGLSNPLTLFSRVNKNAVTTVSSWLVSPVVSLATANGQDAIAEYDNTLTIGVSEYSTIYLTRDALQLIENAIWYRMGRQKPVPTALESVSDRRINRMVLRNGRIHVQRGGQLYTLTGNKL